MTREYETTMCDEQTAQNSGNRREVRPREQRGQLLYACEAANELAIGLTAFNRHRADMMARGLRRIPLGTTGRSRRVGYCAKSLATLIDRAILHECAPWEIPIRTR